MSENKQVPNKVIAVLIVIALLVTIISTWVILREIDSTRLINQKQNVEGVASGNLAVTIVSHSEVKNSKVSGQVALRVNT